MISPIPDVVLDHVAVAMEQQSDAWPRYARDLPARWVGGGATTGFSSAQVEYANGMRVEVLEPYAVDVNDFLRRFLDRNGPGPHHLTFKVKDIVKALDLAEAAGYSPVGVNLETPWWREAFLHPKDAPGIVVQLAQSQDGGDWAGDRPAPDWYPAPRVSSLATLLHVAHAVADLDGALGLFRDLLGAKVTGEMEADDLRAVDLAWPGPGRVRLLTGSPLADWLGGRAGRLHHLAFAVDEPAGVPTAAAVTDDVHEVRPSDNFGVRLLLAESSGPFDTHPLGGAPSR